MRVHQTDENYEPKETVLPRNVIYDSPVWRPWSQRRVMTNSFSVLHEVFFVLHEVFLILHEVFLICMKSFCNDLSLSRI